MQPVYLHDSKAKSYSLNVGQNMYMELLPLPIRVLFDLPVGTVDAAFHKHISWYLVDFPESFSYRREQLTLGSTLYTLQTNKLKLLSRYRDVNCVQEAIEDVLGTFFYRMWVRAIGTQGTQVDIETFLWDDDHEPVDDELMIAFAGHQLISGCLERPVDENNEFKRVFRETSAIRRCTDNDESVIQEPLKNKGGRPSYEEDNWAWDEVNVKGRPREEVYPEWLEKMQPKRRLLSDPERAFRNAIRFARRGKPAKNGFLSVYDSDLDIE